MSAKQISFVFIRWVEEIAFSTKLHIQE